MNQGSERIFIGILFVILLGVSFLLFKKGSTGHHPPLHEGWFDWLTNIWDTIRLGGIMDSIPMIKMTQSKPASYTNECLTKRPYGFPNPTYQYWKSLDQSYASLHRNISFQNQTNQSIHGIPNEPSPSVGSPTTTTHIVNKQRRREVPLDYYHDAYRYCQKNPNQYPCPNHWIWSSPNRIGEKQAIFKTNPEHALNRIPNHVPFPTRKQMPLSTYEANERAITILRPEHEYIGLC